MAVQKQNHLYRRIEFFPYIFENVKMISFTAIQISFHKSNREHYGEKKLSYTQQMYSGITESVNPKP